MSAKIIQMEEDTFGLAERIRNRYIHIQKESDVLEEDKKKLASKSRDVFFEDLNKENVEIAGSHDYYVEDDERVRVNFRVKSRPITEICKKDASEYLHKTLGDYFDKLFEENKQHEITAEQEELRAQAADHPECFEIRLRQTLTHEQLFQLVSEHPDWVEVGVKDKDRYAEIYPEHTSTKTSVSAKKKFVEGIEKMEATLKKKTRRLMEAFLKPTLMPAVIVGNKSRKK